jgi:hypothetical protein
MKQYTIDLEAWTIIEAKSQEEAMALAQGLINNLSEYAREGLGLELEVVVTDGGVTEEDN